MKPPSDLHKKRGEPKNPKRSNLRRKKNCLQFYCTLTWNKPRSDSSPRLLLPVMSLLRHLRQNAPKCLLCYILLHLTKMWGICANIAPKLNFTLLMLKLNSSGLATQLDCYKRLKRVFRTFHLWLRITYLFDCISHQRLTVLESFTIILIFVLCCALLPTYWSTVEKRQLRNRHHNFACLASPQSTLVVRGKYFFREWGCTISEYNFGFYIW